MVCSFCKLDCTERDRDLRELPAVFERRGTSAKLPVYFVAILLLCQFVVW